MSNPLDDAFNVSDKNFLDDTFTGVIIPDDPNLDTIIEYALKAYKEQMDDVMHIEPKNRARYLEVAAVFLNQAKDAMAKKELIAVQRERLAQKPSQKGATEATDSTPGSGATRKELMDRQREGGLKAVKS